MAQDIFKKLQKKKFPKELSNYILKVGGFFKEIASRVCNVIAKVISKGNAENIIKGIHKVSIETILEEITKKSSKFC